MALKRFYFIFILVFFTLISCNKKEIFPHDELERKYILHLPKNLPENAPLLVVMHGYTNKAGFIKFYTRMNRVANDNGFAVVYPQGAPDGTENEETHWNADLEISNINDISFITNLTEELQLKHDLNPDKTFAFGVSNGGFMAYTLAVRSPDKFAAVASVIGTMSGKTWSERDMTTTPVPVLQISGLLDEVVPIDGSITPIGGWGGAPHADTIVNYWATRNNCSTMQTNQESEHIISYKFENGIDDSKVWYYKIDNLDHTWPNNRKHGLKTSELIWEFFSQF